ncbi:efflux RND transporter periplasmic adaptor subunit [Jiangella asiatica]|uniref:HlyD family efflux transporter periplasmic adaptor subunit n=1 Tax=Jiangella asiatica TaxID=2530372 RepID=A0A4R5CBY6_9ACTN|nr:peptidoglycan-binding protein [Jiangella asiatica]TDD96296.1 HlyD family efflux transporter periplasmic adaptor subunit [Jiangella asiatica]
MTATIDHDSDLGQPPRRHRRTGLLWLTMGAVAAAGGGGAYWYLTQDDGDPSAGPTSAPVATAEVTRGTLAATETWAGTLGHGDALTVLSGQGTITRLAAQDAEVTRGTELFRLDERPVTALLGAIPMYRDLGPGDTGVDVEQLEANLVALGYDGFTADDEYTEYTADAVSEWQEDIGAEETGAVGRSDVVFLPEGGRVGTVHADVGGAVSPGAPVLDITGTDQVATLEVEVADRDLLAIGAAVTVVLPDGTEVAGTVAASSVVEQAPPAGGGGEEEEGADTAVAEVEVTLAEPADAGLVGSPIDVVLPVDQRADVLLVPVSALLAMSGGGYGLEVVAADGTTSVVPVEAGLFADGQVEVTGEGIAEGTVVGVAGR